MKPGEKLANCVSVVRTCRTTIHVVEGKRRSIVICCDCPNYRIVPCPPKSPIQ